LKIVIIGAGKVGHKLAQQLAKENHDIVVIDIDPSATSSLANSEDVMCITGNAAEYDIQVEAGVQDCDLVIACTDSDELNMLCCLLYKNQGAAKTIARVRSPEYIKQIQYISDAMGLSMYINPEMEAAQAISRVLIFPAANSVETFAKGKVELVEFTLEDSNPLIDMSLKKIHKTYSNKVLLCAVQRGDDVFIPDGDTVLKKADRIYVASSRQNIHEFFSEIGILATPVRSVMIVGGGKLGYYLASLLTKRGIKVKVVEENQTRCDELSEKIPGLIVIKGDGTDQELLEEERIAGYDAFVSLTGMDEINIILSLYAKSRNVGKAISKVTQIDFTDMLMDLGIESAISPKDITANIILSYVRALHNSREKSRVESLSFLVGGKVEALEFRVSGDDAFLNVPFKDLAITKGCLVASIVRGTDSIIPGGSDCIRKDDDIIIVTTNSQISSLQEIFKVKNQ
jgi:trk system potassium uptake protein TrkA